MEMIAKASHKDKGEVLNVGSIRKVLNEFISDFGAFFKTVSDYVKFYKAFTKTFEQNFKRLFAQTRTIFNSYNFKIQIRLTKKFDSLKCQILIVIDRVSTKCEFLEFVAIFGDISKDNIGEIFTFKQ